MYFSVFCKINIATTLQSILQNASNRIFFFNFLDQTQLGYEPADLTVHPPTHKKTIEGGFIFSHRCLVPSKFFPQIKSGFCKRYSH